MFGKNEAASQEENRMAASGIVSVLTAARHRRRPLTQAQIAAKQEWLQGVVSTWSVGRSI